jgi:lipopolysaccharide transport system ATP-binding protein
MIRLEGISKRFTLKRSKSEAPGKHLLSSMLNIRRRSQHWALKDVSVEIPAGDSVALMGVNGCGKTTLLKIIAGVTEPTSGKVMVSGHAGGLLDLGAGFHPDLTGLENIFLHGTLMGMSRRDIRARLDSIIEFAELGRFIHSSVRHYSSGMFLRLGFAIAVHTEPDILLIDEVIAVGDGYFQWKSMRKIMDMKEEGRTIVFVTHIPDMAEAVCARAIWLHEGVVKAHGPTFDVAEKYNRFMYGKLLEAGPVGYAPELSALMSQVRVGSGDVLINNARLVDGSGKPRRAYANRETMAIEFSADAKHDTPNVGVALGIERGTQGVTVIYSHERGRTFNLPRGHTRMRLVFPELLLHAGNYTLSLSLYDNDKVESLYDCHLKLYSFTVTEPQTKVYSTRLLDMPTTLEWTQA